MSIGHLAIKSKNTLTTNKIVLTNAGADPLVNGEIQMNATTVKAYFNGALKSL